MFLCAAVIAGEQIENAGDLLAMIGGHVGVVNGYSIANREVMSPNFPVNLARQEGLRLFRGGAGPQRTSTLCLLITQLSAAVEPPT
jgi:hypothetical protein